MSIIAWLGFGLSGLLAGLVFVKIGRYRQALIFLAALQLFTFAIKVGYGVVNTTWLAMLPVAYVGAMVVGFFLLGSEGKVRLHWTWLDCVVVAFFALDFLQVFNPYLDALSDPRYFRIGLRGFQQRSFFGLVYFVFRGLGWDKTRFDTIVRLVAYSTALGGAYALAQQFFGFDILEAGYREAQISTDPLMAGLYEARAVGFEGSPFTFGVMCAMGWLCALYLFVWASRSRLERWSSLACVLINGAGVLLSGSRSAYLAAGAAMITFALWKAGRQTIALLWQMRWAVVALLLGAVALMVVVPESTPVQVSFARLRSLRDVVGVFGGADQDLDINFVVRRELALGTWPLVFENPLGYGSGIFTGGANSESLVTVKGYSTWVDNEFSSLALELGMGGVLLLVAIVALALRQCRRTGRRLITRERANVLAALIVIGPVAGFGGQWLTAYPVNVLFWTFVGISAGHARRGRPRRASDQPAERRTELDRRVPDRVALPGPPEERGCVPGAGHASAVGH
jgi:hypothetical protein